MLKSVSYFKKENRYSLALHQLGKEGDHFYDFNREKKRKLRKKVFLVALAVTVLFAGLGCYWWTTKTPSEDEDALEKRVDEVVGLAERQGGKKKYLFLLVICIGLAAAKKYGLIEKVIKKITSKKQKTNRPKGFFGEERPPSPKEIMDYFKSMSPMKAVVTVALLIVSDVGFFVIKQGYVGNFRRWAAIKLWRWANVKGYFDYFPKWFWSWIMDF